MDTAGKVRIRWPEAHLEGKDYADFKRLEEITRPRNPDGTYAPETTEEGHARAQNIIDAFGFPPQPTAIVGGEKFAVPPPKPLKYVSER